MSVQVLIPLIGVDVNSSTLGLIRLIWGGMADSIMSRTLTTGGPLVLFDQLGGFVEKENCLD